MKVLSMPAFKTIAVAKEIESPENPGGLEKRVSLVPKDVGQLVEAGLQLYVEEGAGLGVGFSDDEYSSAGAIIQTADEIYLNKDLIIKFKGLALKSIVSLKEKSSIFCMAHFHSYPERAKMLEDRKINVIAMEEILESPKVQSDNEILGRMAMKAALAPFLADNTIGNLRVRIIQWTPLLTYSLHRSGNRDPRSLRLLHDDINFDALDAFGDNALYVYDSRSFDDKNRILNRLCELGTHLFDVKDFVENHGEASIAEYRSSHPPAEFGLRRIQCLHETGMAGARYGVKLLKENRPTQNIAKVKAVVLGYGNVGQGAIHELYDQGIEQICVLGRTHTAKGRIDFWLKDADIVVNGAEQPAHLRGVNFLVSNDHIKNVMPDGSVVIDLVGGSPTNRSPVEAVLSCTFLTDPAFVQDGVSISALWGWPMMGMMRETAIKYSGQITDVLLGKERLVDGLDVLAPNIRKALVCGPF